MLKNCKNKLSQNCLLCKLINEKNGSYLGTCNLQKNCSSEMLVLNEIVKLSSCKY